jgi:DNA-binding response OmpR family regulator
MGEDTEPIGRLDDVRVLIVDDDQDVLESIDAAFQSEGALTALAADGAEAVKICLDDPPDLVVLDMMLPKRSGFLTLEKIKGREDSPIVIMVTANEGKRHQAYAESLGVDRYMLKPVPLERLLSAAVDLIKARGPVPRRARPADEAGADGDGGRDADGDGELDGDEEDKD